MVDTWQNREHSRLEELANDSRAFQCSAFLFDSYTIVADNVNEKKLKDGPRNYFVSKEVRFNKRTSFSSRIFHHILCFLEDVVTYKKLLCVVSRSEREAWIKGFSKYD